MAKIKSEFDDFLDTELKAMAKLPIRLDDYCNGAQSAWNHQKEKLQKIKASLDSALETIKMMEHSYAIEDVNQKINEALKYAQ